jgi:hypothetical protein
MTTEEKELIMQALKLGFEAMILERDTHVVTYGTSHHPRVLKNMNIDIEIVEKALEIMRLA